MSFLRNRLTRNIGLLVGVGAGMLGFSQAARAAPPTNMQGVIEMGADNPGKFGTNWQTTIWAEQDVVAQAMLTLCATNNARPADASECHEYALNQGQVLTIPNAWSGFQAVPPGGFLWRVDGLTPDQVAIASRTSTPSPNSQPGTLGQGAPSLLIPGLPVVGTSQYVPAHMRDGFRTNIGLMNATNTPSDVLVRIHTGGGNVVAEQTFALPGLGWQQLNDVFTTLGTPVIPNAYIEVVQMTGEKLAVYSSVIDNTSGDPTTFMAKTAYSGQHQLWIPAAAHLNGYNGTKWVTDVNYLNLGPTGSLGGLDFYPYNHDNSGGGQIGQSWLMGNGEQRTFQDVLLYQFALDGVKGSLWQAPLDSHLIWARTFNNATAGTFGQEYPSIFADTDKITGDLEGILVGLSQSTDPATGYRSAVGLLNTGTTVATFHVDLYDDQGTLKGSLDQDVPPMSLFQIDKAYTKVTNDAVNNGRVNIKLTQGQGFAYASITDNITGDPTTEYATIIGPDPVATYVNHWLYDSIGQPLENIWLSDRETTCMWMENCGVTGYRRLLSSDLVGTPGVPPNWTADDIQSFILNFFDGNPANGEINHAWDNFNFQNRSQQQHQGIAFAMASGGLTIFNVDNATTMQAIRESVVKAYLIDLVRLHGDWYGGQAGGPPNKDYNPTWDSEDQTP